MKDYIEERVLELGHYIVDNKATVRQAARRFAVSKSTVHKDIRTRLQNIDLDLYDKVVDVLQLNLSERHIRGGIATKQKYQKIKEQACK